MQLGRVRASGSIQPDESQCDVDLVAIAERAVPAGTDQPHRVRIDRTLIDIGATLEHQVELARRDVQRRAILQEHSGIGPDRNQFGAGKQPPILELLNQITT